MGLKKYFFDSYAIIELMKGNPNYAKYVFEEVTITVFNLTEIYFSALNTQTEDVAEEIYNKYKESVVKLTDKIIQEAMKFRKKVYKDKKISYADAIGYTHALKNNMIFLTGDKEFKDLDNVEFVK
ncbi:MAG: PIN domain-containing protein [Nanoarchaeota archaeon]